MKSSYKHIVVGAVIVAGLFAASQFAVGGQASDRIVGTKNGYAGASQTVVPVESYSSDIPLSQKYINQAPKPPEGKLAITLPLTTDGVREYVLGSTLNIGGTEATDVHVTNIQFTTTGELKRILNDDPLWDMWPKDYPVIYVTLSGKFPFNIDNVDHTYSAAYRVFDGRTGNELQAGAGPK